VKHDDVTQVLPDHVLGALSETEAASVRRHLRGCASCRADAEKLDEGLALFAGVAHSEEPPPELENRVMRVLEAEWADAPEPVATRSVRNGVTLSRRLVLAFAAGLVLVAGSLAWGSVNQVRASHLQADAGSLRRFLNTLGGKDVRVGPLTAAPGSHMTGSVVMYDAKPGEQSWVLILARSPGYSGIAKVSLLSPGGIPIGLHPMMVEGDGDGWTALFTNSDLSAYQNVHISTPSGQLLAYGTAASRHS
jgi:hypothetical protein